MEEFDIILKDIQKVLDKHNVELIVKSEVSFKKLDGRGEDKTTSEAKKGSKGSGRKLDER